MLIEAIEEMKDALRAGEDPALAAADIAPEHGLTTAFLFNRTVAALGDLATFAERDAVARSAAAEVAKAGRRKMALAAVMEQLEAHKDGSRRVSNERLAELVDEANALGGRLHLKTRRVRDPGRAFDRALLELARLLLTPEQRRMLP